MAVIFPVFLFHMETLELSSHPTRARRTRFLAQGWEEAVMVVHPWMTRPCHLAMETCIMARRGAVLSTNPELLHHVSGTWMPPSMSCCDMDWAGSRWDSMGNCSTPAGRGEEPQEASVVGTVIRPGELIAGSEVALFMGERQVHMVESRKLGVSREAEPGPEGA